MLLVGIGGRIKKQIGSDRHLGAAELTGISQQRKTLREGEAGHEFGLTQGVQRSKSDHLGGH